MPSAVLKGVFDGFLRTVYVEPVDSQTNWSRLRFLDTVARFGGMGR
jgi:hypothetical protein